MPLALGPRAQNHFIAQRLESSEQRALANFRIPNFSSFSTIHASGAGSSGPKPFYRPAPGVLGAESSRKFPHPQFLIFFNNSCLWRWVLGPKTILSPSAWSPRSRELSQISASPISHLFQQFMPLALGPRAQNHF